MTWWLVAFVLAVLAQLAVILAAPVGVWPLTAIPIGLAAGAGAAWLEGRSQ